MADKAAGGDRPEANLPFPQRNLRQATIVLPQTGERVNRRFTLRDPKTFGVNGLPKSNGDATNEQTPLLGRPPESEPLSKPLQWVYDSAGWLTDFVASRNGQGVLKCSLAYFLSSLAVFVPFFTKVLGTGSSKHIVANFVIWFHPARSNGSMAQGTLYAHIALLYATVVCYSGMAIIAFYASNDLVYTGQAIVIVLCCGGGLGLLAWVKQRYNDLLINLSCSLASVPIVFVFTRDTSVLHGAFSNAIVSQTLRMLIMAVFISTSINLFIRPIVARGDLRNNVLKSTDAFADLVSGITSAFLIGSEDELKHAVVTAATDKLNSAYNSLDPNLAESRYEHFIFGSEKVYWIEKRLVACMQRLSQDVGGLRSAAAIEFSLLAEGVAKGEQPKQVSMMSDGSRPTSRDAPLLTASPTSTSPPAQSISPAMPASSSQPAVMFQPAASSSPAVFSPLAMSPPAVVPPELASSSQPMAPSQSLEPGQLAASPKPVGSSQVVTFLPSPPAPQTSSTTIAQAFKGGHEEPTDDSASDISSTAGPLQRGLSMSTPSGPSAESTALIFATFIEHLGPPMKSLAFTLKLILNELSAETRPAYLSTLYPKFKPSLKSAVDLFEKSRKEALQLVYKTKEISQANSFSVAANFEEVAASCGHFGSSLQDLAESCMTYLDVLEEFETEVHPPLHRRSWKWLLFWRPNPDESTQSAETGRNTSQQDHQHMGFPFHMPSLGTRRFFQRLAEPDKQPSSQETFRYRLWKTLRVFRRDDIKFAFKVGIGSVPIAMMAYLPATQATFHHWRFDWSLATYMFVCAMTIGGANTTIFPRIKGTCIGAGIAIVVWIISRDNAIALAFFGWVVSLGGFYLMIVLDQGPMSRFILLAYTLSVLYSYAISINDDADEIRKPGVHPAIWSIVFHRLTAICLGILWGLIITQVIWPVSARRKLKSGISLLWLRMAIIWKRAPLSSLIEDGQQRNGNPSTQAQPSYMDISEEIKLRHFADFLDTLRKAAESEFMLRGPFPSDEYSYLLKSTGRMLDGFHALNVLMVKDAKASPGEAQILKYTNDEREQLARRISHLFSVLASSVKLEYPLNDALPEVTHTRDRLLAKVFRFRQEESKAVTPSDEDYELLYAFALVTGQLAEEIEISGKIVEKLYGTLSEKVLKLE
ncbi:MAG: hypothetical protein M1831_007360 [Alyxoria varia]|nr:MAG: hypothetical protein M1831_007360 [Alyxoria varia]